MDDSPRAPGSHRAAGDDAPVHSRRWLLSGAAVALVAGAGGVVAGFVPDKDPPVRAPHPPPAVLVAAAAGEAALIADLDATTGGLFAVRQAIAAVRADHVAHLAALRGLLARYDPAPGASASPGRGTPRSRAQLSRAESLAASASASRAAAAGGSLGALLASISACESTHVALFS